MAGITEAQQAILDTLEPSGARYLPNTPAVRALVSKGMLTRDSTGFVRLVREPPVEKPEAPTSNDVVRARSINLSWVPADVVVKEDEYSRLDDAVFYRSGLDEFRIRFSCGEYDIALSIRKMRAMLDVLESLDIQEGSAFPENFDPFA